MSKQPPPITSLISVMIDNKCIGYLIKRGKTGFEAFNSDDKSLGMFAEEHDAVAAVMKGRAG
jgi:hypothetical protein